MWERKGIEPLAVEDRGSEDGAEESGTGVSVAGESTQELRDIFCARLRWRNGCEPGGQVSRIPPSPDPREREGNSARDKKPRQGPQHAV